MNRTELLTRLQLWALIRYCRTRTFLSRFRAWCVKKTTGKTVEIRIRYTDRPDRHYWVTTLALKDGEMPEPGQWDDFGIVESWEINVID